MGKPSSAQRRELIGSGTRKETAWKSAMTGGIRVNEEQPIRSRQWKNQQKFWGANRLN